MRKALLILGGLVTLVLVVFACLYAYLLTTKPVYSGEQIIGGLRRPVEVTYDDFGVPHVYAENMEDAYAALGYVHAQDRLFQMEMLRRAADGRLSEVLGPDLIKVDKLFRTLGLNQFADRNAQQFLSGDTADFQKAAHAYQRGVNEFVRNGKTPIEFTIIGIPKMEFTPRDIYLAVGFMSFGFAEGLRADPVLEKIRQEFGDTYLADLAIQTPKDAERIPSFNGPVKGTQSLIVAISEALNALPVPLWQGSNGWVISGDRTASGFPILANDTHMAFAQPAVWYEAHIEYPGFSFYGHHVAGIPFALLGNNKDCAWGLTMFENDDTDFFRETINSEGAVNYNGNWTDITDRVEVIKVKDNDDVNLTIQTTPHGPLVNGLLDNVKESEDVSLWWLLHKLPNEALQASYNLNHASNYSDANKAAALFSAPGLNVMYADKDGNIAWWAVAKLPKRPAHVVSKLFLNGGSGLDEPSGFYPFTDNPQSLNPPSGFIYSANNQPDSVHGVLYPGYYYPKARAQRIIELLSGGKKWTPEDVKSVNLDVLSVPHASLAKEMASVLKELKNPDYGSIIEALESWNGDHQITDVAPSVYYNLLSQVMTLTLRDELGKTAYDALMSTSVIKNSYSVLINHENSPWWDDVTTNDKKESRAMVFDAAASNCLSLLKNICGDDPKGWTWGKLHTLTHKHPLSAVKPLDRIFNVGTFTVPGGSEVVNNLHFPLDTTGYFRVTGGPSLRKITDFGDLDHGQTVSPTGQSGVLMSAHYDDQAEMYAQGKFRQMLMNADEIKTAGRDKLILKPLQP